MPQYTVTDPETGRTVTLEGDNAPTERELVKVFNQIKTPQEKALDVAGDVAAEFGPMIAGQMVGAETGPGYFVIAPAAGAYGTYARQKRQIERGERDDYNYWEMFTSGLINAVPASAYVRGGASMGKYLGKTAAIGGAVTAVPQAIDVAQKAAEQKRIPTYDEYLSIAKKGTEGAVIGAAGGLAFDRVSAISGSAKKLWNRLAGKTQEEANQVLQQVVESGTKADQAAAAEIVDAVGQDLGFVRPATAIKSAEESAAAMGVQPVKSAREAASILEQAPLTAEEAASRQVGRLEPKSAKESAAVFAKQPSHKSAEEAAAVLAQAQGPAEQSALIFQRALAEGQSPQAAAAIRDRFVAQQAVSDANKIRASQFQQARAEELQQQMRAGQLTGAESTILDSQGAQGQMHVLDTRPGASARERERLRQRMGITEEDLPTSEDVVNQMAGLRGIGSKQKARQFMEGGSTNVGVMAGLAGGAAALALGANELKAKPDTIVVNTPMGPLKYDARNQSLDDIQQDVAKRVAEFQKAQAAEPHLKNRADYENAPDDQSRLKGLLDWSNGRAMLAQTAKATIQAAGARFPIGLRPVVGAGAEFVRGQIANEIPTVGQYAQSAVASLPRGGTSFGANAAQFAGANVTGEMLKQFLDNKDFTFKDAAEAAARGGLQAAALQTVMKSPLAAKETRRQQANRGEIEMFRDADRLGLVVDPASTTSPTTGQIAAVKLAGGSPKFNHDASRVNNERLVPLLQNIAGRTGNPQTDQNLSPEFFRARLLQEGRAYDAVASLPGMRTVVEDWKRANFNSARQYALNAETGRPENLAAARQFRTEADNLFQQIEQAANLQGNPGLIRDLRQARTNIATLHAIENVVSASDYKPMNARALGVMFEDNPRYFTGELSSIARVIAAQPQAFQNVRLSGTRGVDLTNVGAPGLRYFLQTGPGQRSIGNYGLDPTFLAQMARYGTGAAVQQMQSQPTQ